MRRNATGFSGSAPLPRRVRFIVITPFMWPRDAYFPFDLAVTTTVFWRKGFWRARCLRWQRQEASGEWDKVATPVIAFLDRCAEHDVRLELTMGGNRLSLGYGFGEAYHGSPLKPKWVIEVEQLESWFNELAASVAEILERSR